MRELEYASRARDLRATSALLRKLIAHALVAVTFARNAQLAVQLYTRTQRYSILSRSAVAIQPREALKPPSRPN